MTKTPRIHFVINTVNGRTQCGRYKLESKEWNVTTTLEDVTCDTCKKSQTFIRISEWQASRRAKADDPEYFIVIAYIGEYEPESQPYWGKIFTRVADARTAADETWDWLMDLLKSTSGMFGGGDDLNRAAVVVWRADEADPVKGDFTLDDPDVKTHARYIRGLLVDEDRETEA